MEKEAGVFITRGWDFCHVVIDVHSLCELLIVIYSAFSKSAGMILQLLLNVKLIQ